MNQLNSLTLSDEKNNYYNLYLPWKSNIRLDIYTVYIQLHLSFILLKRRNNLIIEFKKNISLL